MAHPRVTALIKRLSLEPLPEEGGFYRRVYESANSFTADNLPPDFGGNRYHCTSIDFLLENPDISAMHVLRQDEIWHFYEGATVNLCVISPEGSVHVHRLGNDPVVGERRQIGVRAGCIFGGLIEERGGYAYMGCTVAPGFEFEDFRLVPRSELEERFPESRETWLPYTRAHP